MTIESSSHTTVLVGEASGHLLNWLVASTIPNRGISPTHIWIDTYGECTDYLIGNYCGDYAVGGPKFEAAQVSSTSIIRGEWEACTLNAYADPVAGFHFGNSRLEAEARAYVVHLLGLHVLVPNSVLAYCKTLDKKGG